MNEEKLFHLITDFIKDNLTIEIEKHCQSYVGDGFKVSVQWNGEEISSSTVITEHWSDY